MAKETVQIKKTYLWGLLILVGLVIGVFAGYYIAVQKSTGTSGDTGTGGGGITLTRGELFPKYAADLKLDTKKFESCLNSEKYKAEVDSDYSLALNIGAQGTPTFVINGQLVPIGAAPYEQFKQILDAELVNSSNRSLALSLVNQNDPALGKKDAPIVMLEFSDFQCPFCGKFYMDTERQLIKDYVDTGKVLFVYKDFPLREIHPFAQKAAEAAQCANEQGKFWEYHNKLFENQVQWAR